ncbi:MAG TPA: MFS transporter [Paraburkholderia sp.]|uniref:MFS transporter n=1 Tax=Paraburkholderia sp. TaxID=1926495 RepID=UPI002CB4265B|nr:MFS transporter [Paraburkholderia sp.]HTR05607.1 MFS transporter [Paraburkholderia sp.]
MTSQKYGQPVRAAIAAFVGTTIEWYDFYIYGLAAALVFGKVFFPGTLDPGVATLLSFLTLWAGFVARPIGGLIFGHLGDRIGRKTTLVITLVMMGVATTGIGLMPSYAQIGAWAPIGLVLLRVIQGIAVGGEWGGAVLIASESAPKHKSILYSAFAQQGSPTGNLLATLVFFALSVLPTPDFLVWGWRIPFLLSATLVIVGMVVRLKLEEPEDMKRILRQNKTVKLPVAEVLRKHWVIVLLAAGVLPVIHVTYFKTTFALSWATKELGYSQGTFLSIIVIALIVQFITQPLGALLVQRMDMRKAVCLMVLPEFILMPAMFFAIETKAYWIAVVGMCLATIPHSMFYGAVGGILARVFPAKVRYTGLSLSYQLCSLVVGGGTPVLAQWLLNSTGSITGVAIASAMYALVSLVCMIALLNRTGFLASELSTAEQQDVDDLQRENHGSPRDEREGGAGRLTGAVDNRLA